MSDVAMPPRVFADRTVSPGRSAWAGFAWGAVMAGVVTAIAIQLLFTVLGMAIGVSVADPGGGNADAGTVSAVAGAWWLITGTIALFLGGAVLGRLWGAGTGMALHIHALTMWAAVALFGFLVIWSGAGMVSQAASPLAAVAAQASPTGGMDQITRNMTDTQAGMAVDRTVTNPAATQAAAEDAVSGARAASWWSVVGLILGIVASIVGANMVARSLGERTYADRREPAMA